MQIAERSIVCLNLDNGSANCCNQHRKPLESTAKVKKHPG
jgi:hypothetical protein